MNHNFLSALRWARFIIPLLLAGMVLAAPPLFAKQDGIITVNSTDETINPTDGKCTLREAIIAANTDTPSGNVPGECPAGNGADTIELDSQTYYTLSVVDNTDPTLGANGLPIITSDITVNGNSSRIQRSTMDGTPEFRIAQINSGATLTLNAIILAGGNSTGNGSGIYNAGTVNLTDCIMTQNLNPNWTGGAIYSVGTVVVNSCQFIGNGTGPDTISDYGGAIANDGGTLTIADSIFTQNRGAVRGGAVWSQGTLDVSNSSFIENASGIQNGGGGAIYTEGQADIRDSTFTSNSVFLYGGALYTVGNVTVERSTFVGNTTNGSHGSGSGGAIYGSANVTNSTFYQNAPGSFYANGGAIDGTGTILNSTFVDNPDSTQFPIHEAVIGVTLKNSILYKTNCSNVTDGGGNFYFPKKNSACPGTLADPKLGPLQDNGGSTQTMLPAPDSPALNAAMDANCPATDQRGISRPQGARCDIGAVELEKPTAPTLVAPANGKHVTHRQVKLKWEAGAHTASYSVVVRQDAMNGVKVDKANVTATTYKTKPLASGHWYYWRVYAKSNVARLPAGWYKFRVK